MNCLAAVVHFHQLFHYLGCKLLLVIFPLFIVFHTHHTRRPRCTSGSICCWVTRQLIGISKEATVVTCISYSIFIKVCLIAVVFRGAIVTSVPNTIIVAVLLIEIRYKLTVIILVS